MAIIQYEKAFPVDFQGQGEKLPENREAEIASYITVWMRQIRSAFIQRRNIWDDCWKLYRGLEDFADKEDWQSKIVLPKSWASVKMATNAIKRLLATSKKPWTVESQNPDDVLTTVRADQMTDLSRVFLDKAHFIEEFSTGLETGFILGLGVWKLWWGLVPRKRTRVQTVPMQMANPRFQGPPSSGVGGPFGINPSPKDFPPSFGQGPYDYQSQMGGQFPTQLGGEALNPMGWGGQGMLAQEPPTIWQPQRQIVQEEVMEGQLFFRAVDPYQFYWLPGSKLNRWVGTIEEVEIPKFELIRMAEQGLFDREKVDSIQPRRIDERYKMSNLRFSETIMPTNGPNNDTAVVKLTEFYGPLVFDGKMFDDNAHVILGNDSVVLLYQHNPFWHGRPPYIGFSPLGLPFRTEGVGLIEMVRYIDKALSQLANLSVDTLMFRLLPLFEVTVDAFENPEDLETGITPGKMLRKNIGSGATPGIRPVEFQDISSGTVQVAGLLDRSHQEGSLVSDIAEGIPRWRGQQTATESQLMATQSESFMGSMAADIEQQAIDPIVTMALDLMLQFIDTAKDPRVSSILGIGADTLAGMSREEIMELVQGDYKVKVLGISGQMQKAEMLQNLVQFMNLIGQNPQAWLPYINQDALLRRILEAFRPQLHDIEDIISDPETAQVKQGQMQTEAVTPDLIRLLPQLAQMQQDQGTGAQDHGLELQKMEHERAMQASEQAHMQAMQTQNLQAQMAMQGPQGGPQGASGPPTQ